MTIDHLCLGTLIPTSVLVSIKMVLIIRHSALGQNLKMLPCVVPCNPGRQIMPVCVEKFLNGNYLVVGNKS